MNTKLNSNVSIVPRKDDILEFFKCNTRSSVTIKTDVDKILKIVSDLDGSISVGDLSRKYNVSEKSLNALLSFLEYKGILDHVEPKCDFVSYNKFRRVIHFLNDFSHNHDHLLQYWEKLNSATVMIIGLGAVGTWVATNLVQSGIMNLILVDPDVVEVSNLHRQYGYTFKDIGKYKVNVLASKLEKMNPDIVVWKEVDYLSGGVLKKFDNQKIDLVINCADKPNVDTTSIWVGEYCMERNISHIIGGGYNMHLSLIAQTVIPGKSACVKCFEKQLDEINGVDVSRVKKLMIKNRKLGSIGPMCSLIASMIGMEAIKILTGCCLPANMNRRGEFNIVDMRIKYQEFKKLEDCEWCGAEGLFHETLKE